MFSKKPLTIPSKAEALPGRAERMPVPDAHFVNRNRLSEPFPDGLARAVFGMSVGGTITLPPSSFTFATLASVSAT